MKLLLPAVLVASLIAVAGLVPAAPIIPPRTPRATIDLSSTEAIAAVKGEWRYHDVEFLTVEHKNPGPDRKASGSPNKTLDISPKAGLPGYDASPWPVIAPESLEDRRSLGRFCGAWYRLEVTVPETIGAYSTAGSVVVLEMTVDDYAEVWVEGRLPMVLGTTGGNLVAGWNAPNRVVLARDAKPGQTITASVFALNGPMSDPPANFIWVRGATLDFYRPEDWSHAKPVDYTLDRKDAALDGVVAPGALLEKVADGFTFTEGPVWVKDGGYLLFSDPNQNVIYRATPDGHVSVYRAKSGYKGADIGEYRQPGSNGLALDGEGRLTIAEHGNRRITRLEKNGVLTVVADRFEGMRLNSPNDLVYRKDGTLYFSDPPFGLPKFHDDPRKELPDTPVFCLHNGKLSKVVTDLTGPNGLAFSPDEKHLYVANWDEKRKVVMRYDVAADGGLSNAKEFFNMNAAPFSEALDGVKIDAKGNLFVSGPGGLWIIDAGGKHLGTLVGPELPANMAWGGDDGRTLYLTARAGLYRLRVQNPGATW